MASGSTSAEVSDNYCYKQFALDDYPVQVLERLFLNMLRLSYIDEVDEILTSESYFVLRGLLHGDVDPSVHGAQSV